MAETKITIYKPPLDPQWWAKVELTWTGWDEQPDRWTLTLNIVWVHILDYLGTELERYLSKYCPAPKEVMETLKGSLPPAFAACFKSQPLSPPPEP